MSLSHVTQQLLRQFGAVELSPTYLISLPYVSSQPIQVFQQPI